MADRPPDQNMAPEHLGFSAGMRKSLYLLVSFVTCCALPEPGVRCRRAITRLAGENRLRRRDIPKSSD